MKDVFQKYKANFNHFIVFLIIAAILNLFNFKFDPILEKQIGSNYSILDIIDAKLVVLTIVQAYINTFGLLIAKKIIKEESIDQKSIFTESFHYYPRILGLTLLFIVVGLLFVFLLLFPFMHIGLLFGLGVIVLIIVAIMLIPCSSYLIFNDEGIWNSIESGFKIGKKYFFKILGLFIISIFIAALIGTEPAKTSTIVLIIYAFLGSMFTAYFNLYINNLCKIEEG